ncbi:MAG: RsmE family RNA methyltransferase [Terriglobales bacterium]
MTRRRWIADEVSGDRAFLLGRNAEHLIRVLRARVGQEFDISTGDSVRLGRIVRITPGRVEFDLSGAPPLSRPEPRGAPPLSLPSLARQRGEVLCVSLVLAIFKFDRLEWAIEKSTELGVTEIIPVIARRTEPHLAKAAAKRVERWRRIAHEAAQQSRRLSPPDIADPQPLSSALSIPAALRIVLAESEGSLTLKHALAQNLHLVARNSSQLGTRTSDLVLAIGPEGGWTSDELSAFSSAGWKSASLGPTILRAETAALAALAIALSELS